MFTHGRAFCTSDKTWKAWGPSVILVTITLSFKKELLIIFHFQYNVIEEWPDTQHLCRHLCMCVCVLALKPILWKWGTTQKEADTGPIFWWMERVSKDNTAHILLCFLFPIALAYSMLQSIIQNTSKNLRIVVVFYLLTILNGR